MKAKPESQILDRLLDKYERSSFFRDGQTPTRRILLKLYDKGATDFPAYDIESSEKRLQVNEAVRHLAADGLLSYQWMKGEEGHILAKVWLEPQAIPKAYAYAGRRPKDDLMDEILMDLLELQSALTMEWAQTYCAQAIARIDATRKNPALVPTDKTERTQLFQVIRGLEAENGQEITGRVFSMKYLGDSKTFEKTVRQRLVSILRQSLEHDDDTRDEDLLRMVGIVRYPEQFEFRGCLQYHSSQGITDFTALTNGSSLSTADLKKGTLTIDASVPRILTIENRANYFDALQREELKDTLILYHGGQYSPSRKSFFHAVQAAKPENCNWYHWGDLDYGGFSMLARLRREIAADIFQWQMDLVTIKKYHDFTASISSEYAIRLKGLFQNPELNDCSEIINYLIDHRLRLEQEAILIKQG